MSVARVPLPGLRSEHHRSAVIRSGMCELSAIDVGARVSRLRAAGELDAAAVEPLARMLEEQCAAGYRFARLDLAEVAFLDPAALASALGLARATVDDPALAGTILTIQRGCSSPPQIWPPICMPAIGWSPASSW